MKEIPDRPTPEEARQYLTQGMFPDCLQNDFRFLSGLDWHAAPALTSLRVSSQPELSMRALIVDPVSCKCGMIGNFVADVADDRPTTSQEFVIEAGGANPDPASGWVCKSCGITFAQMHRFG